MVLLTVLILNVALNQALVVLARPSTVDDEDNGIYSIDGGPIGLTVINDDKAHPKLREITYFRVKEKPYPQTDGGNVDENLDDEILKELLDGYDSEDDIDLEDLLDELNPQMEETEPELKKQPSELHQGPDLYANMDSLDRLAENDTESSDDDWFKNLVRSVEQKRSLEEFEDNQSIKSQPDIVDDNIYENNHLRNNPIEIGKPAPLELEYEHTTDHIVNAHAKESVEHIMIPTIDNIPPITNDVIQEHEQIDSHKNGIKPIMTSKDKQIQDIMIPRIDNKHPITNVVTTNDVIQEHEQIDRHKNGIKPIMTPKDKEIQDIMKPRIDVVYPITNVATTNDVIQEHKEIDSNKNGSKHIMTPNDKQIQDIIIPRIDNIHPITNVATTNDVIQEHEQINSNKNNIIHMMIPKDEQTQEENAYITFPHTPKPVNLPMFSLESLRAKYGLDIPKNVKAKPEMTHENDEDVVIEHPVYDRDGDLGVNENSNGSTNVMSRKKRYIQEDPNLPPPPVLTPEELGVMPDSPYADYLRKAYNLEDVEPKIAHEKEIPTNLRSLEMPDEQIPTNLRTLEIHDEQMASKSLGVEFNPSIMEKKPDELRTLEIHDEQMGPKSSGVDFDQSLMEKSILANIAQPIASAIKDIISATLKPFTTQKQEDETPKTESSAIPITNTHSPQNIESKPNEESTNVKNVNDITGAEDLPDDVIVTRYSKDDYKPKDEDIKSQTHPEITVTQSTTNTPDSQKLTNFEPIITRYSNDDDKPSRQELIETKDEYESTIKPQTHPEITIEHSTTNMPDSQKLPNFEPVIITRYSNDDYKPSRQDLIETKDEDVSTIKPQTHPEVSSTESTTYMQDSQKLTNYEPVIITSYSNNKPYLPLIPQDHTSSETNLPTQRQLENQPTTEVNHKLTESKPTQLENNIPETFSKDIPKTQEDSTMTTKQPINNARNFVQSYEYGTTEKNIGEQGSYKNVISYSEPIVNNKIEDAEQNVGFSPTYVVRYGTNMGSYPNYGYGGLRVLDEIPRTTTSSVVQEPNNLKSAKSLSDILTQPQVVNLLVQLAKPFLISIANSLADKIQTTKPVEDIQELPEDKLGDIKLLEEDLDNLRNSFLDFLLQPEVSNVIIETLKPIASAVSDFISSWIQEQEVSKSATNDIEPNTLITKINELEAFVKVTSTENIDEQNLTDEEANKLKNIFVDILKQPEVADILVEALKPVASLIRDKIVEWIESLTSPTKSTQIIGQENNQEIGDHDIVDENSVKEKKSFEDILMQPEVTNLLLDILRPIASSISDFISAWIEQHKNPGSTPDKSDVADQTKSQDSPEEMNREKNAIVDLLSQPEITNIILEVLKPIASAIGDSVSQWIQEQKPTSIENNYQASPINNTVDATLPGNEISAKLSVLDLLSRPEVREVLLQLAKEAVANFGESLLQWIHLTRNVSDDQALENGENASKGLISSAVDVLKLVTQLVSMEMNDKLLEQIKNIIGSNQQQTTQLPITEEPTFEDLEAKGLKDNPYIDYINKRLSDHFENLEKRLDNIVEIMKIITANSLPDIDERFDEYSVTTTEAVPSTTEELITTTEDIPTTTESITHSDASSEISEAEITNIIEDFKTEVHDLIEQLMHTIEERLPAQSQTKSNLDAPDNKDEIPTASEEKAAKETKSNLDDEKDESASAGDKEEYNEDDTSNKNKFTTASNEVQSTTPINSALIDETTDTDVDMGSGEESNNILENETSTMLPEKVEIIVDKLKSQIDALTEEFAKLRERMRHTADSETTLSY